MNKKQFTEAIINDPIISRFDKTQTRQALLVLHDMADMDFESLLLVIDCARTVLTNHIYETISHGYAKEEAVLVFDPAIIEARRKAKDPFGDGIPF